MKTIKNTNYQIDENGNVFNSKGQMINKHLNNTGYYQVRIDAQYKLVHRLVAETFLANPGNLPVVDHINGDRTDNRVSNLQWITQSGNCKKGQMNRGGAIEKAVCQYSMDGTLIKEWKSATEAAKALSIPQQLISQNCTGKSKSAKGYRWAFKGNELAEYVTTDKRKLVAHSSSYLEKQAAKKNDKLEQYKADYYNGMELKDLRTKYGYKFVADNPLEFKTTRGYNRLMNALKGSNND